MTSEEEVKEVVEELEAEEETPKVVDETEEEKPKEDEVEVMVEEGADGDEESEERIRGGGKVSDRSGGRNSRRYAPYKTVGDDDTGAGSARVFVGNLSWNVSWQDLKDHFKKSGHEVTRADVLKGPDGRSKGCGLVEFANIEGAQKAILTLNDTELHGRQIFVREDREDHSSGSQGHHAGSHFSSGEKSQSRRVYVGNLSWDVAWQDLKDHMREAGDVTHAEIITEANGRSKGCGIVEYATEEEAQEAIINLTDTELKGRMIFVREDRETSSGTFHGAGGSHHPGSSVYVWNLDYSTSWQSLKDHMRKAGNVDQATILTGSDGQSNGCGIVVYQRPQDAARAIRQLQNSELNGRPLYVREDRMQAGGGRGRGRGHHGGRGSPGGRGGRGSHSSGGGSGCQVYVGNLSFDTSWRELKDHFRQCGQVDRVEVMEYPDGKKKGFGTVRFFKAEDANDAIDRLNGVELQGRELEVRIDHKVR
jgi:RNA recognition motif-containing protein